MASVWISIKLFPSQLVGVHSCAAVFYAVFNDEREAVNCAETIYVGTFTETVFKGFKAQLIFKKISSQFCTLKIISPKAMKK